MAAKGWYTIHVHTYSKQSHNNCSSVSKKFGCFTSNCTSVHIEIHRKIGPLASRHSILTQGHQNRHGSITYSPMTFCQWSMVNH